MAQLEVSVESKMIFIHQEITLNSLRGLEIGNHKVVAIYLDLIRDGFGTLPISVGIMILFVIPS